MTSVFEPVALDDFLLRSMDWNALVRSNPDDPPHLSAGFAKGWNKCPEQMRRRYFLGHKAKPSAAQEWGSADHDTAGFNYRKKIDTEKDLPVPELQEFFVNEFEERVEKLGGPDEIEWDGTKDDAKIFGGKTGEQRVEIVKNKGRSLVTTYREQIAPSVFPQTVEEKIVFEPDGLGLPVVGYIDSVIRHRNPFTGEFTGPLILERKTRSQIRAPKPEDVFQARVYQLAKPLPAEFHISARPSARVQAYDPFPVESPATTVASLRAVMLEVAACYTLYGIDHPWPDKGRLHDWACGFCAFKSTCPWWHEEYWPK